MVTETPTQLGSEIERMTATVWRNWDAELIVKELLLHNQDSTPQLQ